MFCLLIFKFYYIKQRLSCFIKFIIYVYSYCNYYYSNLLIISSLLQVSYPIRGWQSAQPIWPNPQPIRKGNNGKWVRCLRFFSVYIQGLGIIYFRFFPTWTFTWACKTGIDINVHKSHDLFRVYKIYSLRFSTFFYFCFIFVFCGSD